MWQMLPQTTGEARADVLLALCKEACNRSGEEALALSQTALEIYESLGAAIAGADLANANLAVATALKKLNRTQEAGIELAKAVAFHREDHFAFLDDLLRMQASWYGELGEWQSALECQIEAIALNEIDGDEEFLALSLKNAADCYWNLAQYQDAKTEYERAVPIFKELKLVDDVGYCYRKIAESNFELGNMIDAIAFGKKAADIAFFGSASEPHARAHLVLVKAHIALGDLEAATPHLVDAQALANFTLDRNWELVVEVEQERANHMKAGGFEADAIVIEARLSTIRETLG